MQFSHEYQGSFPKLPGAEISIEFILDNVG